MSGAISANLGDRELTAETAYYLACASKCVYVDGHQWVERLGLQDRVTFFNDGPFRGLLGRLDGAAILAFRGTFNVCNCLTDADTRLLPQPFYPGRVHRGFAEAVEAVWSHVRELLRPLGRNVPLWLTGHSLGGAMATLASVRLARDGYTVRGVCTFGSPRVGDRKFRDSYLLPNYRFVNDNDLVAHLPLQWCYKHVGTLRLVDSAQDPAGFVTDIKAWKTKKRHLSGKAKRVQRAYRREADLLHTFEEFDWLSDHRLDEYLAAIQRFVSQTPQPVQPALSQPVRRIDRAHATVLPPFLARQNRSKLAISHDAFIAAIGNQS